MSTTEGINELYGVMNEDISFQEKAQRALEIGERYLNVDNGHLTQIHPESEYWKAISSTDPPEGEFPPGLLLDLKTTYCRRVISEDDSIALHNASEQGWEDDPAFQEHGLYCYHGSPLKIDDETYGTVCFVSKEPREEPFTEEDTTFAELIARLLEYELRRERTEKEMERLEEFANVLSHDIRNPLTAAVGRVELANDQHESEHLAKATEALDRIEEIISEVLAMALQGQAVEETDEIRLTDIAAECWEIIDAADASLTVDRDLAFRADESRLQHLFENLFRNAVEHGGEDVTINVGSLQDGEGFYVENDGPPIPEEDREKIFETDYTTGRGNLGLGMSIIKGVATAHGWQLTVTDGSTGGARFEFSDVIIVNSPDE